MRRNAKQRTAILEAAIRVFADRGGAGTTIRDIGRAAGLNSALLYYYFDNKEALFRAAVERVMSEFMERLRARPARFASGRDRLRFVVETGLGYYTEHPERLRLITVVIALHQDMFAAGIRHLVAEKRFTPLDVVEDAIRAGQWRSVDPMQAWWCIAGPCLLALHVTGILPSGRTIYA